MKLSLITKAVLSTAALLVATTGLATAGHSYKGESLKGEACPPPPALLGGFYVGGQVGYDNYRVRHSIEDTLFLSSTFSNPLAANGWVGGLFLGYGQYFTNFYLGGELFGNYSGADGTLTVSSLGNVLKNKAEARGSWGLALLPGMKLSDTLLVYLRGGYTWANLKNRLSVNSVDVVSTSSNRGGWTWGVGMESLVWDAWSLRGEFNHTSFNSRSSTILVPSPFVPGALVPGATVKFSPYDNQFMVGAVYHFA